MTKPRMTIEFSAAERAHLESVKARTGVSVNQQIRKLVQQSALQDMRGCMLIWDMPTVDREKLSRQLDVAMKASGVKFGPLTGEHGVTPGEDTVVAHGETTDDYRPNAPYEMVRRYPASPDPKEKE